MTREEKIQILQDAVDRAYETVANTSKGEMHTTEFKTLLENIGQLNWLLCAFEPEIRLDNPVPEPEPVKPVDPEPVKT